MTGQHVKGLTICLTLLTVPACTESPTAPPPSTPLSLESSTLFSGGEGVLVSESFRSIELAPHSDSLGTQPRRWSEFQVLFDGDTVDSWRVSEDKIAFRVPPSYSGTYSIEVRSPLYAARPVQTRVIGGAPGYGPYWMCGGGFPSEEFVPIDPEEILMWTFCWRFEDSIPQGIVHLTPGAMFQNVYLSDPEEWTDELWFFDFPSRNSGSFRTMWVPGPSVRSGNAVVERYPASEADSSSTWVWRFGADPASVERIDCLPPQYGWGIDAGYTAVELAPGVCLSMTKQQEFYLGGSQLLTTGNFGKPTFPSFRVAKNGTAALRNIYVPSPQGWPVFRPDEGVAYEVEGYLRVEDVAFSPEGEVMYVVATTEATDGERLVLDARDTASGTLADRLELGCASKLCYCSYAAVARDSEHLWILRRVIVDGGWQARVELRDPTDLEVVRSVAVPEHLHHPSPDGVAIGCSPVLVPDATGRRAYIFGMYYSGHSAAGYLMELY